MSDLIQNGLLGALLSKTPIAQSAGENPKDAGENAEAAIGAPNPFGDLFNIATATGSARLEPNFQSGFQTGLVLKRPPAATLAAITPTADAASVTAAPTGNDAATPAQTDNATPATASPIANAVTFKTTEFSLNVNQAGQGVSSAKFKELLVIRPEARPEIGPEVRPETRLEGRVVNSPFTKIDHVSFPVLASNVEKYIASQEKTPFKFTTIKVGEVPSKDFAPSLSTVKQAAPFAVADEASAGPLKFTLPSSDAKGFEIIAVRPRATAHAFESSSPDFDLKQAFLEFAPDKERFLEARLVKSDTPAPLVGSASLGDLSRAPRFDVYGRPAPGVLEQFTAQLPVEAEIRVDPAFAPSSSPSSVQSVNSLSPGVSTALPAQTAMSGVLPQIQAAVFARSGLDVVEVRLDPPDLGRVRIEFNVENGDTIKAVLGAERSETLDYLRRNIVDLENQLKQSGFSSISFEFSDTERQFGAENAESQKAEQSIFDGDETVDFRPKIYLSARENARLDLLL